MDNSISNNDMTFCETKKEIREENANSLNGNAVKKQRISFLDTAKFICMFLVVFGHAQGRDNRLSAIIYTFHLPCFFVINGITLKFKKDENFGDFLVKKLKTYVVPVLTLGFIEILLTKQVDIWLGKTVADTFVWNKLIDLLGQNREYTIWFVACLFTTDVLFYFVHKLGFGNLIAMGVLTCAVLFIAIFFNKKLPNRIFFWNLDVALFGELFVYFGYLFGHEKTKKVYGFLTKNRVISLLFGLSLLIIGLYISNINYVKTNMHLEMWGRRYKEYYLVLPSSVIASFGVILLSKTIDNKFFAEMGKTTIIMIAFHQVFTLPAYNNFIAKSWWLLTPTYDNGNVMLYLYGLCATLFCFITLTPFYYLLKYSPFAFTIGKKMPDFYKKACYKLINSIKNEYKGTKE